MSRSSCFNFARFFVFGDSPQSRTHRALLATRFRFLLKIARWTLVSAPTPRPAPHRTVRSSSSLPSLPPTASPPLPPQPLRSLNKMTIAACWVVRASDLCVLCGTKSFGNGEAVALMILEVRSEKAPLRRSIVRISSPPNWSQVPFLRTRFVRHYPCC